MDTLSKNIRLTKQGRNVHVAFVDTEKLNIFITRNIKEALFEMVKKPNTNVILNMAGIKFMDTSMFSALGYVAKGANIFGSRIVLANVSTELMELIELVRKFSDFNFFKMNGNENGRLLMAG